MESKLRRLDSPSTLHLWGFSWAKWIVCCMHHWIAVIRIAAVLIEFVLKLCVLWMCIMRASCHGIFYTIVVWHDVLQRERMIRRHRPNMKAQSCSNFFLKYWSNFVTWFNNVWIWYTQSRTAWIPLLSEIWLFKWPQVTIYMGTCPIPKLGCIKTLGHIFVKYWSNFVTWFHNVWIWYTQSRTAWIPLLSEIWLFKWPQVTQESLNLKIWP